MRLSLIYNASSILHAAHICGVLKKGFPICTCLGLMVRMEHWKFLGMLLFIQKLLLVFNSKGARVPFHMMKIISRSIFIEVSKDSLRDC